MDDSAKPQITFSDAVFLNFSLSPISAYGNWFQLRKDCGYDNKLWV